MKSLVTTFFAAALSLAPTTLLAEQEVIVNCNDQMQFDKKAFEVKVGEEVKITVKNIGKLPKVAMGHNLVILKKGEEVPAFAMKAMTAKDTDFIPADEATKGKVLANSKLLGPGETDTVTVTFKEAGVYNYLCSFPGHFGLMQGKITVK